jgi:TP901 family phage tail tape measure protein
MGDFKLQIDIAKPDVDGAERALGRIFSKLVLIDKRARSVDNRMKSLGGAGANQSPISGGGGRSRGGSRLIGGLLGGVGFGSGAAGILTTLRALESVMLSVAGAAKNAAKEFGEFENSIVAISRISGIAEDQVGAMSEEFLKLSSDIPVSSSELQKFAETASRFGIKGREGVQAFAETFGRLQSIIGPVTEETTKSVARIANLSNFPIEEIDKFANAVVVLGKNFATTEDQIIRTGERIAGDISQFNVSADQVAGLATAFDALGVKAELGGSAMVRILNAITKAGTRGGRDLERLAEISNTSAEGFRRLSIVSPIEAFNKLVESGGSATEIMDRLNLSGVRVQGVLGRLTSRTETFTKAMNISRNSIKNNNVLMDDADRQAQTLSSRFSRISNTVSAAFIKMGSAGNENLDLLTDNIIDVVEAFAGLDEEAAKKFPGVANLGKTLGETFNSILETINKSIAGVDKVGAALGKAASIISKTDFTGGTFAAAQEQLEKIDLAVARLQGYGPLFNVGTGLVSNDLSGDAPSKALTSLEIQEKRNNLLKNEAQKLLPDIIAQADKYLKKSEEIDFANSNRGLTGTELRLEQLRKGFQDNLNKLEAPGLELINGGSEAIQKLKDTFKKIEEGLLIQISTEIIDNLDRELEKVNATGKALIEQDQNLTSGPSPDVNAITTISEAADFIAESRRTDKETKFEREQIAEAKKTNDTLRKMLQAQKEEEKLEIANFRNRP